MPKYVVHPHLDLDAIACLTACNARPNDIMFVSSSEIPPAGTRPLDHPAGEKGRLDPDGKRHAALCSIPEAAGWPAALRVEIDEGDSTGLAKARYSLREILAGMRMCLGGGLRGEALDRALYAAMRPVLEALLAVEGAKTEAAGWARRVTVHEISPHTGMIVAVLPVGETPPALGIVLNERGVSGAIYSDGHNIGVARYPGRDAPDLRKLEPHLPQGWFIHSAGFLAAWGSRKAPARTPPPTGGPQTQMDLLELMRRVFGVPPE